MSNWERGGRGKAKHSVARIDQSKIAFHWDEEYSLYETCDDCLVALSQFDINLLISCMRFAYWPTRWIDVQPINRDTPKFQNILSLVECLELKLADCLSVKDLLKSNMLLVAALTGQQIDLDAIDEGYLTGIHDFSQTGLANRLGPETTHDSEETIQAALEKIRELLAAISADMEAEDIEDELRDIATILGAVAAA